VVSDPKSQMWANMEAWPMSSSNLFNAFATARGEGLHPKLRELFDRAAARPFSEMAVRRDGMLQAGPNPASEALGSRGSVTTLASREQVTAPPNSTTSVEVETSTALAVRARSER
jgi:hypothetical protein